MDTEDVLKKIDVAIKALQDLKEALESGGEVKQSTYNAQWLRNEARKILQEQGVPTTKSGFTELQDAICIVAQNPEKGRRVSMPGGLYSIVAEQHGKHHGSMHYSMRSAIGHAKNLTLSEDVASFINQAAEILRKRAENKNTEFFSEFIAL